MYKILVCDDEKDIVSALKIYLGAENYEVVEASNGKEAVKIAREQELHLILLDIMMPVMDGISALNEIRQFSNVPVILLTAKSEEIDMILAITAAAISTAVQADKQIMTNHCRILLRLDRNRNRLIVHLRQTYIPVPRPPSDNGDWPH